MRKEKMHWRPSPGLIVVATAMVVIISTLLIGWLSARRYRVTARVEIAEPAPPPLASATSKAPATTVLPDGEVARTATRIREASGLLMGLAVLSVSEQMNNRPALSRDALIELMRPFAPASEIAASGWTVEALRERSFDPKEINQLSEWARRYATNE
jgi:hypothetical protein